MNTRFFEGQKQPKIFIFAIAEVGKTSKIKNHVIIIQHSIFAYLRPTKSQGCCLIYQKNG
jgi:hypothetical protein